MKRLLILASIALLAMGAAACTREKPTNETPPPATQVGIRSDISPAPGTPGVATTTPITSTTPVAVSTPVPTAVPTQTITPTVAPLITVAPLATNAPAPTSVPVPSTLSAPGTYTVQWGDTLFAIAAKFGTTTGAIAAANPGLNPNLIVPGQVLRISAAGTQPVPSPTGSASGSPPATCSPTYTVQRGDWLYEIARRFGVSVTALTAANPGFNPNLLYPGRVLNIPCGSGTVPSNPGPGTSGSTYTVRQGDTLFLIAVRAGTSVYALQIANHLPNPNFIYPGQVLIIPR